MNYSEHHKALIELKDKMEADKLIKSSYYAVLSAISTAVAKAAQEEGTTPTLTRLRKAHAAKKETT